MTDTTTTTTLKTTEIWIAKILAALLTGAYATGLIPTSGTVSQIAAIVATVLGYLGFVVGRSRAAGTAALMVLCFALAATQPACTHATRATMSGEFKTCGKADLGELLPNGLTLLGDVAGLIEGNSPTLEGDLTSLGATVTIDAVKCAVAAVEAVLQPSAGSATTGEPLPGLLRAQQWAASH